MSNQDPLLADLTRGSGAAHRWRGSRSPSSRRPSWLGLFKALGDPVRLRLLSLIASHEGGEACVCDLSDVFDVSGPTISHHLKVLREAGLITGERRGTWVYYRVLPAALARLSGLLSTGGAIPAELMRAGGADR